MAYMNQEKKATIKAALDKVLKPRGIKYSLRVRDHMSITCTISAAPVDFLGNFADKSAAKYPPHDGRPWQYLAVNPYWISEHFTGEPAAILSDVVQAMQAAGYYDKSDAQIDYFDTAYYYHVNIGQWDKPFKLLEAAK